MTPVRAPVLLAVAALAAACGDTLVDHRADIRQGPGGSVCDVSQVACQIGGADVCKEEGPQFCGATCVDCTQLGVPENAVPACLGPAPGEGSCDYECTGGLLKCPAGCCPAVALAAGAAHSCAITTAGGLYCWGGNGAGQVTGTPGASPVTSPRKLYEGGVTAVAAGAEHTCAVVAGEVRCWGRNLEGQAPVVVGGLSGVTALAAGSAHTCALRSGGAVTCWGATGLGQDGGGSPIAAGATALVAGADHTCALMGDAVLCWGSNASGQLGDPAAGASSPSPVTALTSGMGAVAAFGDHACAATAVPTQDPLSSNVWDSLLCWGNAPGPTFLLDAAQPTPAIPMKSADQSVVRFEVTRLVTGRTHVCVQRAGEVPRCLGPESALGQLGGVPPAPTELQDVLAPPGSQPLAAGADHSCAVSATSGGVLCWGSNASGQLGDGTTRTPGVDDARPLGGPVELSGR